MPTRVSVPAWLFCVAIVMRSNVAISIRDNGDVETARDISPLIVGGREANINEFPFLVNIVIVEGNTMHLCGGALIRMDLVLTAVHCVYEAKTDCITVVAGDHDIKNPDPTEQLGLPESIVYHEDYNSKTMAHDIALIKLSENFTKNEGVQTIKLPETDLVRSHNAGKNLTVSIAGWGLQDGTLLIVFNSNASQFLRTVEIPVVNDAACNRQLEDEELQFCAGVVGKSACVGDGGGPVICHNANDTVCGIGSFGHGCGLPGFPGVYTDVFRYLKWIEKNGSSSQSATVLMLLIVSLFTLAFY